MTSLNEVYVESDMVRSVSLESIVAMVSVLTMLQSSRYLKGKPYVGVAPALTLLLRVPCIALLPLLAEVLMRLGTKKLTNRVSS